MLTPREKLVMTRLVEGSSYAQIAGELLITKNHAKQIAAKALRRAEFHSDFWEKNHSKIHVAPASPLDGDGPYRD